MSVTEGCSTISDINGTLLFYSDGMTVWDSNHLIMANGTGLMGGGTPSQSSVILKKPSSSTIYYIFTLVGTGGGLYYSIVDMALAGGSGSVTVKNMTLCTSMCSEQLAATNHCNGIDKWIVVKEFWSNNFNTYCLTSAGVSTTAIQSSVGFSSFYGNFAGCMKFSPNGKKLGIAHGSSNFIYDFDSNSGVISNSVSLSPSVGNGYGCEFSPDGTKYYTGYSNIIYQVDLCNGNSVTSFTTPTNGFINSIQLAPNGKIYVTSSLQQSISVFNNPNLSGTGSGFVFNAQSISPNLCRGGLPNFSSSHFFSKPSLPNFTISALSGGNCLTRNFVAPPGPSITCQAISYSLTNVAWNFGDPGSGANNTSFLNNPSHVFSGPGTYTTQLIMYYTCGGGTDTLRQTVTIQSPTTSVSSTSITCASLGSATVSASAGLGPYTYTWLPVNQTSSVATGLSPGTYSMLVHDAGLNCVVSNTVSFSSLIPLTASVSSSPSITCNGASTGTASVFNIGGGSASQTFLWTNGLLSYTHNPVSTLSAGSWSSTITDALTGCQVFSVFSIAQPPALTLNLSSGSPSICAGGSVVLSSTLSGGTPGYAYNWTGGVSTDSFVFSNTTPASYVYTLNALDAYSCAVSNTLGVDVVPLPSLLVGNVSICPLETATLMASGATSYTWNNTFTGATYTDNPTSFTQYTVLGSALGCTNSALASVNIKPTPNPVLSSNSPVCEQSTFSLSASSGTSYAWSGPGGFSSFASVLSIPSVSLTQAGVYQVTVTGANGCTATASQSVVIKPLPSLSLSASAASICLGVNAATLSASGTGTLNQWYALGSGASFSTNAMVQVSPAVNTTYSVNSFLNGCVRSQSLSVSVVAPPLLNIALSSNSFCAQAFNGSPNTITLTSSGASAYTLTTPNHFANPNPSGPASPVSLMPPYLISGPSTATLYGSNGVCTVSTTAQFSVVPNPTASVSNPTPVICAGQSYTYTSSGASSYVWSSSTPGSSLYTSGNVAVVNPSIQAVFSVYGSSLGCQSALQNYTLSVNPLPTVAVVPNPTYVCIGSSTELSAKSNGTSFVWYPQNITGASLLVAPSVQQQYTVVASLNNCTQSAVAVVSVMPLPVARIVNTTPQVCVNENVQMLATGGLSYLWQGPTGIAGQGATLSFVASSKAFEGIYTVTVTDELGCKGRSQDTLRLLDLPLGTIVAGKDKGCVPLRSGFVFDMGNNPEGKLVVPEWYVNNRHMATAFSYSQVFVSAGNYSVQAKVKGVNGCVNTSSLLVNVYPKPKADFGYSPSLPVENMDEVLFVSHSEGASSFDWFVGVNRDQGIVNREQGIGNREEARYLFEHPGVYPVVLLVKNEAGCSDTLIKTINVEPDVAVYIPNAFTPNGDGKNEGFMPVMRGIKTFSLQIFNRWGQLIFESSASTNTWDGTYQGQDCKQDVYNYTLRVLDNTGKERVYAGGVMLYR